MLIENAFTVAAPPDEVYRLMLDVERIAPCIPGAEVTGAREDGGFDAKVTVKVGPVTMAYRGSVAIAEQDDAARTAAMQAKGTEARGQGTAQATMRMAVAPEGDASRVSISTDLRVTGRVAQMGRGIMQDVATRMINEMASCIERRLAPQPEPEPQAAAAPAGAAAGSGSGDAATAAESVGQAQPPQQQAAQPIQGLSLVVPVLWRRVRVALAAGVALGGVIGGVRLFRSRARS